MQTRARWAVEPAALAVATAAAAGAILWAQRGDDVAVPLPSVGPPVPFVDAAAAANSISGSVVRDDRRVGSTFVFAVEPGRTVRLEPEGGAPRSTTTDAWGRFTFPDVEPGRRHDVVLEAAGCATVRAAGIVLLPAERREVGRLQIGAPATITVPVTDEAGRPIAGAVVEAFADRPDRGWSSGFYEPPDDLTFAAAPAARAVTDAEGRAVLPLFGGATWTLAASAPGKVRAVWPTNRIHAAHFSLPDAVPLRGSVRDVAGRPVASALVLARAMPPIKDEHHGARYDSAARWHRTTADASGAFLFDDLPPGVIEFLAGPPGAAPFATASLPFPGATSIDIEVPALARVRGRITAVDDGAPVAGVVIRVQEKAYGTAARCVTDDDGRYEFAAPGTGTWEYVRIEPPTGWCLAPGAWHPWDRMLPGDERVEDVRLGRTGTIVGHVPAVAGAGGAAEVRVHLEPSVHRYDIVHGVTLADGRFRFDDVPPGRVAVFAAAARERHPETQMDWIHLGEALDTDPRALDRAAFDLPAGHAVEAKLSLIPALPPMPPDEPWPDASARRDIRVRVRVRTADGLPLRNAWAWVISRSPPAPLRGSRLPGGTACCPEPAVPAEPGTPACPAFGVPVGQDGSHEATETASPGDSIFACAADDRHTPNWTRYVVTENGDAVDLEVVLQPRSFLRGRVVCGDRPVAGAVVGLPYDVCARTRDDGTFEVAVDPGHCRVRVGAPGFVTAHRDVGVPPGGSSETFELTPARTLTGRVIDEGGRAWTGVRVTPLDVGTPDERDVTTGADGSFALRGLPRAPVRLRVVSPRWAASRVAPLVTEAVPADAAETTIVVRASLAIEGRAFRANGVPLARGWVLCEPASPDAALESYSLDVWSDDDGRFRVTGLPDGEYVLRAGGDRTPPGVRIRAGARDVRIVMPRD